MGEFKVVGTFASNGKAVLVVGLQQGTTVTTNYTVKFVFKSTSTARTTRASQDRSTYVRTATGQPVPHSTGTVTATRCSFSDEPQSAGLVRFGLKPGARNRATRWSGSEYRRVEIVS